MSKINNKVSRNQLAIKAGDAVIVTDDFGKEHESVALDEPVKLGGHTWCVKVEGRGLYALCRVQPTGLVAPARASAANEQEQR